jgi:hypothetical protein
MLRAYPERSCYLYKILHINYTPFLAKAHKHCTQFFFSHKRKTSTLMFNLTKLMIRQLSWDLTSISLCMVES